MKRKRLKRAEVRRRKRGLALVAAGMAAVYLVVLMQTVGGSTPAFITVALFLTQLFVVMGSVVSLRWLRLGAFITLFSAAVVAFMFSTALDLYVPVIVALLGALVYSLPHLVLGLAQWELAGRTAMPPDEHDSTPDVDRLTLRDEAVIRAEGETPQTQRGQRLQAAVGH